MNHITPTQGIENLRTLYAVMTGVPDRYINLNTWRGQSNSADDARLIECKTAACAVGWACVYPPFKEQGLSFSTRFGEPHLDLPGRNMVLGFHAAAEFFGISHAAALSLFIKRLGRYDAMKMDGTGRGVALPDRLRVMRRIRRYLATHDHITWARNEDLALQEGSPA